MYTKLATAIDAGEAPDIMNTNFAGCAYLYENGMLTDLTDVVEGIGKDRFVASYIRTLTVDDHIWGLPDWSMHTSVWYRKDLFEQKGLSIPTNWEEFKACAEALCIDEDNDGNIDIYGFPVPMDAVQVAPQTYYEMLYSAGVTTVDPKTGEYCFGKELDMAEKTLQYMIDLYKAASPPAATAWSWGDYRNALVEGTVAMTLDMGAVIGNAQANNPDMVEKLGCFDFPGPDGTKYASFGSGYAFVAGNTGSDEKIALVKEVLTKLYTPERRQSAPWRVPCSHSPLCTTLWRSTRLTRRSPSSRPRSTPSLTPSRTTTGTGTAWSMSSAAFALRLNPPPSSARPCSPSLLAP